MSGQQVVTELVINSDTSGADSFTQAMNGAEQAANNGVASLTGMNIGLAALGTGAIAALVGVKELLDYVASANKDLADMATTAKQVGLTLTDFQGLQFGGQIAGLSTDQINTGLEKSASLLNDASRNSNSLSKELDANGLSVKNANGQLISQNQLLVTAANLIQNANNPGDALAIAQMLGFTKEWIPLLEQGGTAMSGLAAEAQAAGAVIDSATIQKAQDFDAEWRKSSVEFSSYMKAALADLLPYLDDLIQKTAAWIKTLPKQGQAAADSTLKDIGDAGVPESGVIKIDVDSLNQATRDFNSSPAFSIDTWVNLGKGLAAGFHMMTTDQAAATIPGYAAGQITEPSYPTAEQMDAAFDKANPPNPGSKKNPLPGLTAADYDTGNPSKVASKDVANDAVDNAINALEKHTQATLADANAVGLGDAALAGFKADAAETAAVLKNGGAETDAQVDKFSDLKDEAIAAAGALAEMKVQSSIQFGTNTAFLGSGDVAIATQLKGIHPDVATALASVEGQALKTNAAFKELSTGIENDLVGGLTDIVDGSKSAGQGFSDMGLAIIKTIDQMIIKMLVVEPIMKTLQSVLGFSSGPITLGTSAGPTPFPSAHGNAFDRGNVIAFAAGGVVDGPTIAPMALFGEAGPEAIVPLKRGSDGNLGIASSGGGGGGGVSFGDINIQVPEGTSSDNAAAVGASVKNAMIQVIDARLAYHSRPRGMLNSGT